MRYEPNDEDRRRERALEGFGTREPHCSVPGCGETDWRLMTGDDPKHVLCYEHSAEAAGRSGIELQHPAGQHNDSDTQVPMPGNLHRLMDEAKREWPLETLRNPDGSPLRQAAASVRCVADWLRLIIDRLLGWIPPVLEALDTKLAELFGAQWWLEIGLIVGAAQ